MTEPTKPAPAFTKVGTSQMTRTVTIQKVETYDLDKLMAQRKRLEATLAAWSAELAIVNQRIAEAEKLGLKAKEIKPLGAPIVSTTRQTGMGGRRDVE